MNKKLEHLSYQLKSRIFSWKKDMDGDLGLVVAGMVAFVKYKDHTLVLFPWEQGFPREQADKWQGCSHAK